MSPHIATTLLATSSAALASAVLLGGCAFDTMEVCEGQSCEDIAQKEQESIFGADDRVEYASATSRQQGWANSVGHLVDTSDVTCTAATCNIALTPPMNSGNSVVPVPGGPAYPMCTGEKFATQMRAGFCSSFLVGPDLVATAGHCLDDENTPGPTSLAEAQAICQTTNVVFGYTSTTVNAAQSVATVPVDNNYWCSSVVDIKHSTTGTSVDQDWAIFRLNRAVVGRAPHAFRRAGRVSNRENLTTVGYPLGIPLKVAANGTTKQTYGKPWEANIFLHSADTQGGNSGSPLINSGTGTVEGVHVSSPGGVVLDSTATPPCVRWTACPATGCTNPANAAEPFFGIGVKTALMRAQAASVAPRTFEEKALTVTPSYRPFTGDFDGDGESDIYWFGPLAAPDAVSWGNSARTFVAGTDSTAQDYKPFTADFDGDGNTDIFWYGPGVIQDRMSWGTSARTFGSSTVVNSLGAALPNTAAAVYQPLVGDFNGDGYSDIFWHAPGAGVDLQWFGQKDSKFFQTARAVSGTYTKALVGDFNGDGRSDVFWYLAGGASQITFGDAARSLAPSTALTSAGAGVPASTFSPLLGDFDGDGRSDIYFYAAGNVSDIQWFGRSDNRFDTKSDQATVVYKPVVTDLDGDARDDILWYSETGTDKISWGASNRAFPTANSPFSLATGLTLLTADFDGNAAQDLYAYAAGNVAERVYYGRMKP